MSEWQQLSLGSLMEIIGGGTPKTSVSEYWGGDIPWLSVVDFNTGLKFVSSTEKTITQEGLNNSSTKLLNKGDIIISARGTVGVLAILDKPMTFNQSCYGIRSKKGISDTDYLYYLLTDTVRELTQISHGGVFDTITRATFDEIEVAVPPLPEQKAIASVLSSLDDKIGLLHRQNKTLEAMAETLFRHWFIEEAKEDWEEVTLADVCTRITDGSHSSPASVEDGYPMASVKDMYDWGINQSTCRKISKEDYEALVQADCKALQGDILIAKDGSYLKHVFLMEESLDVVLLSSIAMLRPNGQYHPMLLTLFLKLDSTHDLMQNIVTGAVIPRIVLKDFRKFPIQLPPKDLQDKAVKIIKPIFEKCWENNRQIQTLENLRDSLLPKLMSGEIRVQYQTEEVA
ncbi:MULTISPECIES: restriction endonuclease subunit S [Acinetobacter]|uniref:Restriction endonuclease subunit S n=1 Tax=Acinetobacter towneri TaxID=202956 RepID=A0AAP9KID8_9GAMM|nr:MULTISPECIES: restriction endonuclease subunit S [Acinetobacter]QGM26250.1 restriction endonuclease subunit S [Acinetobacter towneri]